MENKNVGWLIIGIAVVMTIIVLLFNSVLKDAIGLTCSHGPTCEMYTNLNVQTGISLSIVAVVFIIGLVIMFSKPKEKIIIRKIKEKKRKINLDGLDKTEKDVIKLLQDENGAIFQKTLMEKIGVGKVGITRLLDKLEAKQLIERKRRGMNNIVVLKD
ncbi:MAG: hypothetical protein KKF67_00340 [Nanoarchaeota archaeon]|nr:hypothetical protein [Nanoarchaeota archaeon]